MQASTGLEANEAPSVLELSHCHQNLEEGEGSKGKGRTQTNLTNLLRDNWHRENISVGQRRLQILADHGT